LYAQQILNECKKDINCTIVKFQELAKTQEQSIVLETFDDVLINVKESSNFCHPYAHRLGLFLYNYLGDLNQALSSTNPLLCGGAVYHGIVQNFMISEVAENNISPSEIEINQICPEDLEHPQSIDRWECLHGVGHGLTATHDYDVISAIERCKEFERGWESVSCAKGLFMENINNYVKTGTGAIQEDDIFFPCNKIDERFAPPCYHYQVRYLSIINDSYTFQIFEDCSKITDFAKYCFRGFGNLLGPEIYENQIESETCLVLSGEDRAECYKGIAMLYADNISTDEALDFCKIIPQEFKMDCYGEVGKWIHMVYSKDRQEQCSKSEKPYFDVCMNASLEGISIL